MRRDAIIMGTTAGITPTTTIVTAVDQYPDSEEDWTLENWKRHTLFLRRRYRELSAEVADLKSKLSRRKKSAKPKKLTRGELRQDKAWEVLRIRQEREATGRVVRSASP